MTTIYGWDMSHYDWDRGLTAAEIQAAPGIAFMTHKIGEGTGYTDPRFDDFWRAARGLRSRALLGAYYVNHPGDQASQADRFVSLLDQLAPGWRVGPFILQVDAERFDYMPREPNTSEIRAFVARLRVKAPHLQPIVYAPKWVYGDRLRGLDAPLWASNYGGNPVSGYRQAYPGNSSSRWAAYSGQTPAILQYGSRTKIGTQSTCDANAFRGTLAELTALVYPEGDDMTQTEFTEFLERALQNPDVANRFRALAWSYTGGGIPAGKNTLNVLDGIRQDVEALSAAVPPALAGVLSAVMQVDEEVVTAMGAGNLPIADVAAILRGLLGAERAAELGAALTDGSVTS